MSLTDFFFFCDCSFFFIACCLGTTLQEIPGLGDDVMGTKGLSKCRKILSIHISLHLFSKLGVVLLSVVVCKVLLAWGRFTVIGFHGIGFHIFVFTF